MRKKIGIIHIYPSAWLIKTLQDHEWEVVLIGPMTVAADYSYFDVICVDLLDENAVCANVTQHHVSQGKFDLLLPVYEGATILTARLSRLLNLPCYSEAAAVVSRNKYLSYLLWSLQHIPTPKTVPVLDLANGWRLITTHIGTDVVIKLVDSMNSQGVFRVQNHTQYQNAITCIQTMLSRSEQIDLMDDRNRFAYGKNEIKLIAQEFCTGEEVGIDLLLDNNEGKIVGIFQKALSEGPYFAEQYSIWPTSLGDEVERQLGELAIEAVKAMGVSTSAAHVEIRMTSEGPKVLEAGLRSGGAYTVKASEILTGINQYSGLASLLMKEKLTNFRQPSGAVLYGGVIYTKSGRLLGIKGVEIFSDINELIDFQLLNKVGDNVYASPESAQPHFCYYLLVAKSRQEVLYIHHRIQNAIKLDIGMA